MFLNTKKGEKFSYRGNPYIYHHTVDIKIQGKWMQGFEYEALYDDRMKDVIKGDRFVRLVQDPDSKEILHSIKHNQY